MITNSVVPLSALGFVRAHSEIEKFAKSMVELGAISPRHAISALELSQETGLTGKAVYNKLKRPGFVMVDNGRGNVSSYYFLFTEGFGSLAVNQGHTYYPEHLGPLATHGSIPKVITLGGTSIGEIGTIDVVGTAKTELPDGTALVIRAVGVDDTTLIKLKEAGLVSLLEKVVANPVDNLESLDNLLVILSGVRRGVANFLATADFERDNWLRKELSSK